jgi:hypothetical protein
MEITETYTYEFSSSFVFYVKQASVYKQNISFLRTQYAKQFLRSAKNSLKADRESWIRN